MIFSASVKAIFVPYKKSFGGNNVFAAPFIMHHRKRFSEVAPFYLFRDVFTRERKILFKYSSIYAILF